MEIKKKGKIKDVSSLSGMGAYSGYGYRCSMSIAEAASSIQNCHRQINTNASRQS